MDYYCENQPHAYLQFFENLIYEISGMRDAAFLGLKDLSLLKPSKQNRSQNIKISPKKMLSFIKKSNTVTEK